ncbi:MAG: cytochrome P450, partial [Candidatus Binatia bacterium]
MKTTEELRPFAEVPRVHGLPLFGNGLLLANDPFGAFGLLYRKFGPIFRIKLPGRLGPWITILAGRELHDFTSADRDRSIHCRHVFRDFVGQLGTDQYLSLLNGDAHKHMRRMIAPAFAREAYAPYVKEMIELVCERARAMPVGKSVRWSDLANQIVVDLAWLATANCRDPIPMRNVLLYGKIFVGSGAVGWPRMLFRLPAYVRAKNNFNQALKELLDEHRANPPGPHRPPDYLDALVQGRDEQGRPYSDEVLVPAAQIPMKNVVSYGAAGVGYLLYTLLKRPDLMASVLEEVDAAFRDGTPALETLKRMQTLRATLLETLRLYSIVPGVPRTSGKPFTYAGYEVPEGETIILATSSRHRDPTIFTDPESFDPDRFLPPRSEQRCPGAFGIFGAGIHACPARGFYELLVTATVIGLLRTFRFELDPKDHVVNTVFRPLSMPSSKLRFRIAERRAPSRPANTQALATDDAFAAVFSSDELRDVEVRRYEPGAVIIRQGDVADEFFIMKSGSVEVVREAADAEPKLLAVLETGQFFGEIGLLHGVRRTATVRAIAGAPVETYVLDRDRFSALVVERDLTSRELATIVRRRMMGSTLARALPKLGLADIGRFSSRFEWRSYPRGSTIIRQGDPADRFFIVFRGEVELVSAGPDGGEVFLARLGEG